MFPDDIFIQKWMIKSAFVSNGMSGDEDQLHC